MRADATTGWMPFRGSAWPPLCLKAGRATVALAFLAITAFAAGAHAEDGPAYPIKVSPTGRYLVDSRGKPFLLAGESPQAMMVNISEAEAEAFFANRRSHGFNAAWINLICSTYTGGREDGSTIEGLKPFEGQADFSRPVETYFAHCDRVIRLAAKYHTVVFLDPAETGSYLAVMQRNGIDKCGEYGHYLGKRYARFDNIVWMHGNDYDKHTPENDALTTAIAQGIRDFDHRHIHTAELDAGDHGNTIEDPRWAAIVDLNAAYTYGPTYLPILEAHGQQHKAPTFLVESGYEFEHLAPADNGSPHQLRVEEYQAALSGSTGQLYGNGYTWPFKPGWKSKLDTPGAIQFGYLQKVLLPRRWWKLVPDELHVLVTAGFGTLGTYDYVTAGVTSDGSLALIYMPTARTITVDMARFAAPVTAQWYDPASGRYSLAAQGRLANSGSRKFAPPGDNADGPGNSDWVLVIETRPPHGR
jgi:hypothetical protein